ncbi:hypothetical protein SABIM44S_02646 [Streptomyces abikoensis]
MEVRPTVSAPSRDRHERRRTSADRPLTCTNRLGKRVGGNPSRVRISYPPHSPSRADEAPDRITGRGPRRCPCADGHPTPSSLRHSSPARVRTGPSGGGRVGCGSAGPTGGGHRQAGLLVVLPGAAGHTSPGAPYRTAAHRAPSGDRGTPPHSCAFTRTDTRNSPSSPGRWRIRTQVSTRHASPTTRPGVITDSSGFSVTGTRGPRWTITGHQHAHRPPHRLQPFPTRARHDPAGRHSPANPALCRKAMEDVTVITAMSISDDYPGMQECGA